jgi:glycosyltransferase involved in cell wall biosynthesis
MRIVELAPWEEPVPPKKYGGTELVVHNITQGLVERGHEVYLFASGDSKTSAHLVPILRTSMREMFPAKDLNDWRNYLKFQKISEVLERIKEIKPDIVHSHLNWRMVVFSKFIDCPMISTIHGPLSSFNERETYKNKPGENYVSISNNQRKAMPGLNWVKTVYNGIDTDQFELGGSTRDYFVFLGRTSPEKGLAEICKIVKGTKHVLKIAAKVDSVDAEYFEKEIKPHIDGKQIQFLGELGHEGKKELLKHAKALLLWLNWEEPFGLVVIEAMACGTPVITNNRGSMPELIVHGKTGFLARSLDEMRGFLDEADSIDPRACREHVKNNFSKDLMVSNYIDLMERLVKS